MENDSLEVCRGATKEVPGKVTQRVVLSFVASVFDPFWSFCPSHNANEKSAEEDLVDARSTLGRRDPKG